MASYITVKNAVLLLIISILFTCCLNAVYFNIEMAETTHTIKTSYPTGKLVQRFYNFPYHGGSVTIQNDFSFDRDIAINISDANVAYQGHRWKLHFMGDDLFKDTIHIDGDENVTTLFSVPSWYKFGDTLKISFDSFLKDLNGAEYHIQPVFLVLKKSKRAK
jgi:hypothetical protein